MYLASHLKAIIGSLSSDELISFESNEAFIKVMTAGTVQQINDKFRDGRHVGKNKMFFKIRYFNRCFA